MVAIDQRESMRTIYAEQTGTLVEDDTLRDFKVAAARALSPHASAILVDTIFGLRPVLTAGALHADCGLIVAADALVQQPGGPVTDTDLDAEVEPAAARATGAAALKLLIVWRDDHERERRRRTAGSFIRICRAAGLLSVVEVVVRAPAGATAVWDRESAAVEAAREMSTLRPDLYKAEVPFLGQGDPSAIERGSRALSDAVGGPWVVLSAGVPLERFEDAVAAACRGGASGFLAGRAIWSDAVTLDGLPQRLTAVSVPRLQRLSAMVDRLARPWWEATGDPIRGAAGSAAGGRP
jgi:sulfofructosephosphate aldolase